MDVGLLCVIERSQGAARGVAGGDQRVAVAAGHSRHGEQGARGAASCAHRRHTSTFLAHHTAHTGSQLVTSCHPPLHFPLPSLSLPSVPRICGKETFQKYENSIAFSFPLSHHLIYIFPSSKYYFRAIIMHFILTLILTAYVCPSLSAHRNCKWTKRPPIVGINFSAAPSSNPAPIHPIFVQEAGRLQRQVVDARAQLALQKERKEASGEHFELLCDRCDILEDRLHRVLHPVHTEVLPLRQLTNPILLFL